MKKTHCNEHKCSIAPVTLVHSAGMTRQVVDSYVNDEAPHTQSKKDERHKRKLEVAELYL